MVGDIAVGGRQGDDFIHDLLGVAGAGADLDALHAQPGNGVEGAGDQRRVFGDFLDLQGHEALVDGSHVVIRGRAAEGFAVAFGDLWLVAEGADVVPLAHAHRATGFFDGNLYVELGKGLDKNLRGGE